VSVHRILTAAAAVAVLLVSTSVGPAGAEPPATQVITAVAVGPNGEPINGYQDVPYRGNLVAVEGCNASPSAVADDIYTCAPTAAGAGTCWPSTPGSMLCVDDPWTKELHRVTYAAPPPQVQPPAISDPFAIQLDDGTHCKIRNGGSWGGRDDGYVGVYYCGVAPANFEVLWQPSQGPGTCIDRSAPAWTVKVGQLGSPGQHFPPPQTRVVTTAWFAGNAV
jgi:hypothetical protein